LAILVIIVFILHLLVKPFCIYFTFISKILLFFVINIQIFKKKLDKKSKKTV